MARDEVAVGNLDLVDDARLGRVNCDDGHRAPTNSVGACSGERGLVDIQRGSGARQQQVDLFAAPPVAASNEQIRINYSVLIGQAKEIIGRHQFTIIEGAGGLDKNIIIFWKGQLNVIYD